MGVNKFALYTWEEFEGKYLKPYEMEQRKEDVVDTYNGVENNLK